MDKIIGGIINTLGVNTGNSQGSQGNPYPQNPYQGYPYNVQPGQNASPVVDSGPYVIRSKLSGRALDVSNTDDWGNVKGDAIIYKYVGGKNQQFYIQPEGDFVVFKCVKSGKVLDAEYKGEPIPNKGSTVVYGDVRVRQNNWNGSFGQKWRLVETPQGSGEYIIYNANGKVMDVSGEDGRNNVPVVPYEFHGRANQVWFITPASSTPVAPSS